MHRSRQFHPQETLIMTGYLPLGSYSKPPEVTPLNPTNGTLRVPNFLPVIRSKRLSRANAFLEELSPVLRRCDAHPSVLTSLGVYVVTSRGLLSRPDKSSVFPRDRPTCPLPPLNLLRTHKAWGIGSDDRRGTYPSSSTTHVPSGGVGVTRRKGSTPRGLFCLPFWRGIDYPHEGSSL